MKKIISITLLFILLCGCNYQTQEKKIHISHSIKLSDTVITVDDNEISSDENMHIYKSNDIIYYEKGRDFTYGAGLPEDEHSKEEADNHTVINITKPGTYALSGKLSHGQIAIDLGKDAETDPNAVVTLYLDGVNINCDVAPAIIFYNVYECGDKNEENARHDISTTNAGANLIIADDSTNKIHGSYVARIYKTYELNEDSTEVISNKKLHKYDGAIHTKMSMNISGEERANGKLYITGDNEGISTEMHLTINSGKITINSNDDGINANEDNISVVTFMNPNVKIRVNGFREEGDCIDSNGWIVIYNGTLKAETHAPVVDDTPLDASRGMYIYIGNLKLKKF